MGWWVAWLVGGLAGWSVGWNEGPELHQTPAPIFTRNRSANKQQLSVPLLVPMLEYQLRVDLRYLQPAAGAGGVRLAVVGREGGAPLMRALVRMPLSELAGI